jgi:hypothetical protein
MTVVRANAVQRVGCNFPRCQVVVEVGGQIYKTNVSDRKMQPIWNEKFTLWVGLISCPKPFVLKARSQAPLSPNITIGLYRRRHFASGKPVLLGEITEKVDLNMDHKGCLSFIIVLSLVLLHNL